MKGTCEGCGKVRELRKAETEGGKRFLCRACRKEVRQKVPASQAERETPEGPGSDPDEKLAPTGELC